MPGALAKIIGSFLSVTSIVKENPFGIFVTIFKHF
jgi:hypothetical protein